MLTRSSHFDFLASISGKASTLPSLHFTPEPLDEIVEPMAADGTAGLLGVCLLYTSPSPRDTERS
eukprot:4147312-Karenia_brevis.AAC.1